MSKQNRIFNMYDMMEFPEYKYEEYPKVLYHPKGLTWVESPGERVAAPWAPGGFEVRGRREHVISKRVNDKAEEAAALKEGWHKTLAEAQAVRDAAQAPSAA